MIIEQFLGHSIKDIFDQIEQNEKKINAELKKASDIKETLNKCELIRKRGWIEICPMCDQIDDVLRHDKYINSRTDILTIEIEEFIEQFLGHNIEDIFDQIEQDKHKSNTSEKEKIDEALKLWDEIYKPYKKQILENTNDEELIMEKEINIANKNPKKGKGKKLNRANLVEKKKEGSYVEKISNIMRTAGCRKILRNQDFVEDYYQVMKKKLIWIRSEIGTLMKFWINLQFNN